MDKAQRLESPSLDRGKSRKQLKKKHETTYNSSGDSESDTPKSVPKINSDLAVPFLLCRVDPDFHLIERKLKKAKLPVVLVIQICDTDSAVDGVKKLCTEKYGDKIIVYKHDTTLQNVLVLLVTKNKRDKYMFFVTSDLMTCYKIRPQTTEEEVSNEVISLAVASGNKEGHFVCFSFQRRVRVSELRSLPNLTEIFVVNVKSVTRTINIRHQRSPSVEYKISLKGVNVDSLSELKQTFLQVLKTEMNVSTQISPDMVWFTYQDTCLTDSSIMTMCGVTSPWPLTELDFHTTYTPVYLNVKSHHSPSSGPYDLDVHYRPSNSVVVVVSYTQPLKRQLKRLPLVVPRDITARDLRLEVSRATKQKPGALRIQIGQTLLGLVEDLQQALCAPNCIIGVEVMPVRALTFKVVYEPEKEVSKVILCTLHPYNTVADVKSSLSTLLHVSEYIIRLKYQGQHLRDELSIEECHIQDRTKIEAIVYRDLTKLTLMILGDKRRRKEINVRSRTTTVRDLKQFAKGLCTTFAAGHDSEIIAWFQNRQLSDSDTLVNAGFREGDNHQRVILKRVNSLCFSALSATPRKTFITFQNGEEGSFKPRLTMTDGRMLFKASSGVARDAHRGTLLTERRATRKIMQVKGIRKYNKTDSLPKFSSQTDGCPHLSHSGDMSVRSSFTTTAPVRIENPVTQPENQTVDKAVNTTTRSVRFNTSSIKNLTDEKNTEKANIGGGTDIIELKPARPNCTGFTSDLQSREAKLTSMSSTGITRNPESNSETSQTKKDTVGTKPSKRTQKLMTQGVIDVSDSPHCSTPVPRSLKRSGCESDGEGTRRKYTRTIVTEESIEESDLEPGVVEFKKQTTSSISLQGDDAEKMRRALMIRPSTSTSSITEVVPFPAETRIVPYHVGLEDWDEAKYKYIDKKIILAVARQLGRNGELVIRQLGVPDHIVAVASERRGKDIVGFFLDCLIQWCEMKMEEANPHNLKAALAENDRQDLVQLVDDHLSGKSGYMTN